jgi:hypothetical protein
MVLRYFNGFVILALICLSALVTTAQTSKCGLQVNVFDSEEVILLIEAKVTIKDLKSGIVTESAERFEPFIFRNVPEGDYEITATKNNYKQGINKVTLNCAQVNDEKIRPFGIILQKGNANEKVLTDERESIVKGTFKLSGKAVSSQEERQKKFVELNDILNYKAVSLGKPVYPLAAKATGASGIVYVWVEVDEQGNVSSAQAVSGHPLLHMAAIKAAKESKFPSAETLGVLIYNFVKK